MASVTNPFATTRNLWFNGLSQAERFTMNPHATYCPRYAHGVYGIECTCGYTPRMSSDEALAALREKLSPKAPKKVPTVTHGPITAELCHDEANNDYPGSLAEAHMIRIETPQGYVEVTVSNGATHIMISEARLGQTQAEFLMGSNGTFQKIG